MKHPKHRYAFVFDNGQVNAANLFDTIQAEARQWALVEAAGLVALLSVAPSV
jgi:hypothetical protein